MTSQRYSVLGEASGNGNDDVDPAQDALFFETPPLSPISTSARKRNWTVALFSVTTVLLFADQNLMSPNLTAIAQEFEFSDEERGTFLRYY
jgi:hypothetical protein